jgi:hypothetical protein
LDRVSGHRRKFGESRGGMNLRAASQVRHKDRVRIVMLLIRLREF